MFLIDVNTVNFAAKKDDDNKSFSPKNLAIGAGGIVGIGGGAYVGDRIQRNNIRNNVIQNDLKLGKYYDRYNKIDTVRNLETKPVAWLKENYGEDGVDNYFKNKKIKKGYKKTNTTKMLNKQIDIHEKINQLKKNKETLLNSKRLGGKILGGAVGMGLGAGAAYGGYKLATRNKDKKGN